MQTRTLLSSLLLCFAATYALPLADVGDAEPDYSVDWTIFDNIPTVDLDPVPSLDGRHLTKRRDALDLRDFITLYWQKGV